MLYIILKWSEKMITQIKDFKSNILKKRLLGEDEKLNSQVMRIEEINTPVSTLRTWLREAGASLLNDGELAMEGIKNKLEGYKEEDIVRELEDAYSSEDRYDDLFTFLSLYQKVVEGLGGEVFDVDEASEILGLDTLYKKLYKEYNEDLLEELAAN
jgi:hypothetical protein